MRSIRRVRAIALALALLPAGAAVAGQLADGTLVHDDDARRLAEYHAAAGDALLKAYSGGDPADLAILTGALRGTALPPDQAMAAMAGDWSCRMIKLGRLLPIVVYQPFRCTIGADGRFAKLTGSQRSTGDIHRDGDRLVYLGTGFIAGDTPPAYADLPAFTDPGTGPQRVPEIGIVEITGKTGGRIMFPDPYLESRFNILLLAR